MSKLYKCNTCGKSKQINEYYTHKSGKRQGKIVNHKCKVCISSEAKSNESKKEYIRQYHRDNYDAISASRKEYFKEYYSDNKERLLAYNKQHKINNPDLNCAREAKRRSAKLNRTPKWLSQEDLSKIKSIYKIARSLSKKTGEQYVVDHIVPLQGKLVSGLHVPWNLQVITKQQNAIKYNKLIEDMI